MTEFTSAKGSITAQNVAHADIEEALTEDGMSPATMLAQAHKFGAAVLEKDVAFWSGKDQEWCEEYVQAYFARLEELVG